jgi:hypothetical protein
MAERTREHSTIWLSPRCPKTGVGLDQCEHPDEIFWESGGRLWCEDCVWGECPGCGAKPVRYVLAEPHG